MIKSWNYLEKILFTEIIGKLFSNFCFRHARPVLNLLTNKMLSFFARRNAPLLLHCHFAIV